MYLDAVLGSGPPLNHKVGLDEDPVDIYLRLRYEAGSVAGFVSFDGQEWEEIGRHEVLIESPRIGVRVAGASERWAEQDAAFAYFIERPLS